LIDLSFIILIIKLRKFDFLKNKNFKYFLILYLYLIFNSYISLNYEIGLNRNLGFIRLIILFVSFNFFFLEKNFFNKVFFVWLLVIIVVLLDVYLEAITGENILGYGDKYGRRIVSFFKDEPIVGGFIYSFFLILIGNLLDKSNFKYKHLIFLFALLLFMGIFLTGERSNTIKAFIGISVFFIMIKNITRLTKINSIVIISFVILVSIFSSEFLKLRFIDQPISVIFKQKVNSEKPGNQYIDLPKSGFELFKNNFFFGVGNKNYRFATCDLNFQELENKRVVKNEKYICSTHPHQIYFELLSEHGLVGTLTIMYIFYILLFSKWKIFLSDYKYIQLGCFIYLINIFLPLLPSGAFFSDYLITLFIINLSIFYGSNPKLNIFNTKNYGKN
tara:strand:- start:46 stop:1212 length:1167 start_codon:yes stop_codon:yes gene_type:complete